MAAFAGLLGAAVARLQLYYAARMAGLMLTDRDQRAAALAALQHERAEAILHLQQLIREQRRRALGAVRNRARRSRQVLARPIRDHSDHRRSRPHTYSSP